MQRLIFKGVRQDQAVLTSPKLYVSEWQIHTTLSFFLSGEWRALDLLLVFAVVDVGRGVYSNFLRSERRREKLSHVCLILR